MAKNADKGMHRIAALKASLPAAVARRGGGNKGGAKGPGVQLMVVVPPETLKAIRDRAHETDTTTRVLVLEALKRAGFPVPVAELTDRRRTPE